MISWEEELRKVSHRDYTTGSLETYADSDSIYNQREHDDNEYVVSGIILETVVDKHILIDVKSAFQVSDILEVMPFLGKTAPLAVSFLQSISGVNLEKSKPGSVVKIPYIKGAEKFNIIRKRALR
jgi:putative protease